MEVLIIKLLKKYWELFGSGLLALLIGFLSNFKLEKIQIVMTLLMIQLLIMGIFKFWSNKLKKNIIDKVVDSQKPLQAIEFAKNPTGKGEELAEMTITTFNFLKGGINGMKDYFSKVSKLQGGSWLVIIISAIVAILIKKVPQLQDYEELFYASIVTAITSGLLGTGALGKKPIVEEVENQVLTALKKDLEELENLNSIVITKANNIKKNGGALSPQDHQDYNNFVVQKASINKKINALKVTEVI